VCAPEAGHLAIQALELQAPPTGEVAVERTAPPGFDGGLGYGLLYAIRGQVDPAGARDRLHLLRRSSEQAVSHRIGQNGSDVQPGDGRDEFHVFGLPMRDVEG
jgi:hypothetical protein